MGWYSSALLCMLETKELLTMLAPATVLSTKPVPLLFTPSKTQPSITKFSTRLTVLPPQCTKCMPFIEKWVVSLTSNLPELVEHSMITVSFSCVTFVIEKLSILTIESCLLRLCLPGGKKRLISDSLLRWLLESLANCERVMQEFWWHESLSKGLM